MRELVNALVPWPILMDSCQSLDVMLDVLSSRLHANALWLEDASKETLFIKIP